MWFSCPLSISYVQKKGNKKKDAICEVFVISIGGLRLWPPLKWTRSKRKGWHTNPVMISYSFSCSCLLSAFQIKPHKQLGLLVLKYSAINRLPIYSMCAFNNIPYLSRLLMVVYAQAIIGGLNEKRHAYEQNVRVDRNGEGGSMLGTRLTSRFQFFLFKPTWIWIMAPGFTGASSIRLFQ